MLGSRVLVLVVLLQPLVLLLDQMFNRTLYLPMYWPEQH
jgi:hypothetical protein